VEEAITKTVTNLEYVAALYRGNFVYSTIYSFNANYST